MLVITRNLERNDRRSMYDLRVYVLLFSGQVMQA